MEIFIYKSILQGIMKGRVGWFVLHLLLVLALLLFMLKSIFGIGGYLFWTEVVALLGLTGLGIIGVAHHFERGKRGILFYFYGIGFLNVLVIAALTRELSIGSFVSFVLSLVGLIITFNYGSTAREGEDKLDEHTFNGEEIRHEAEKTEPLVDVTVLPEKKAKKKKGGGKKQKKARK